MGRLFFKLYYAGLSNCRMSLDIGVGLAHLTGRTLIPYGVKPPWNADPLLRRGVDYAHRATVLDLYTLPVPLEHTHVRAREIQISGVRRLLSASVAESVLRTRAAPPIKSADFKAFRNRREYVFTLDEGIPGDADLAVDVPTLGMFSHFFYAGDALKSELRRVAGRVRPRKPYRDLARRIADSLAPFHAVHIRRGDFSHAGLSPRADQVTGGEVTRNLATRYSRNDRLVVCTDNSSDKGWFAPLHRHFREVVYLDQLLLASWGSELRALPYHDDAVLGLITQLVAARAECFVGTLFSTFTAMIQRARGLDGRQTDFLYCYSDWDPLLTPFQRCEYVAVQDGPYSWNRILYPVSPSVHSWFREWPESFQDPAATPGSRTIPEETVVLRAAAARVHGVEARYESSNGDDNIGFWTNRDDIVTWDFAVASDMSCDVEIRYACPDDCAGSTFTVALESHEEVAGRVAATGSWTTFCNWQRLGSMDVRAGRHTLAVRIVSMPAAAAMNLAGIRLTPLVID